MSVFSLLFSLSLSSLHPSPSRYCHVWLMDHLPLLLSRNNLAEKLFAEMTEKDGGTYDALIQGLIKVERLIHNSVYTWSVNLLLANFTT